MEIEVKTLSMLDSHQDVRAFEELSLLVKCNGLTALRHAGSSSIATWPMPLTSEIS